MSIIVLFELHGAVHDSLLEIKGAVKKSGDSPTGSVEPFQCSPAAPVA
ncbi:MAG: hypothetical protein JRF32_03400 [Deltaproteobacteria bacterium]|nr:hypothetical protein [Deltaproteobacteria bacterium]